jgi:hypothetical protein
LCEHHPVIRRVSVLALATACGTPGRAVAPVVQPVVASAPPPAPPAPIVRSDAAAGGIEAPHAGPIVLVAVTPDGTAALTADASGGVRLWPALDGSQEPRVVAVPEPHALAIGPRAGGYTAAVLDAAGGLYLASIDGQGTSRTHVSLPADPRFLGVAMSSHGLVAWRADQTIVLLDGDGVTRAQLATKPGERIVTIAVTGDDIAALLDRGGTRGVRGLSLDAHPAWNDFIELGDKIGDELAVAPSGTRVAVRDEDNVLVIDRAGHVVDRVRIETAQALGFVDEAHVIAIRNGALVWLAIGKQAVTPLDSVSATLAIGGGRVISAMNSDLVVATPAGTRYLGYDVESPALAQPAADGQLLIGLGARFLLLDRTLRVAGAPAFTVPPGAEIADLRWLGGDAWALEVSSPDDGKTSLELVAGGKAKLVTSGLAVAHVLMYEPSTKLLTLSLGTSPSVYRFDPGKHELVRVASVPGDAYVQTELVPVAPARARGARLLRVTLRERTTVAWLADPAHLDRVATQVTFAGAIAGADAAGNAYGWEDTGTGLVLAVYRDGKRTGTLPADGPVSLWPDPQGARIAEVGTQEVTLVGADGKVRWARQLAGVSQALWLADGSLAVISGAGIARLDPATGAVTAARCGWGFGASARPHPPVARIEPVCTQLEPGD